MNLEDILVRCAKDEAVCQEATKPPWFVVFTDDDDFMNAAYVGTLPRGERHDGRRGMGTDAEPEEVIAITLLQQPYLADIADGRWDENAAFIAHARTALERANEDRRAMAAQILTLDNALQRKSTHYKLHRIRDLLIEAREKRSFNNDMRLILEIIEE